MNSSSNSVLIAIIGAFGGIVTAYITYVASQHVQNKRAKRQPRDRMEQMFDGYERLIKAKDLEDERKTRTILTLEKMTDHLQSDLRQTKTLLATTREEVKESKMENSELRQSLKELRKSYDLIRRQAK